MQDLMILLKDVDFSSMTWQIITPLVFSIADIVTGFIQAVINNNVDSQKMRTGLWHKALLVIILLLGYVSGFAFNLMFLGRAVSIFIIVMELVSIIENVEKAGINLGPLGDILKVNTKKDVVNASKLIDKIDIVVNENKAERKNENE